ncbi:MAG: 4-hydroxyphenylpyruvate dioxygenase [Alphaproteobacteria bacterium]|jgi:4-hydroxyphenylpyruvate dioxygenase|nr:4-hydroxyphenylpyruvate dioxygenase [Alphaproteobacteria bacterium]MBT6183101.1 4-hydroxyphenylpyruvate dioxygenase [archaeon]
MSDISVTGIEYIEFYVSNAYQSAHFYARVFGFKPIAYAGLETGLKDRTSILLECRNIRIILTSPLTSNSMIAKHIHQHGDSVRDIAFSSQNISKTIQEISNRGAMILPDDIAQSDSNCNILKKTFSTFGSTCHSLIEKLSSENPTYPFFTPCPFNIPSEDAGLKEIDHIAVCVEQGTLQKWSKFYQNTLDFYESHKEDVYTETSGMESIVVRNDFPGCVFPLTAPAAHKEKSQIREFLKFHGTSGVQHVAFLTDDIFKTVQTLRQRGIQFLSISDSYYESLENRGFNFDINKLKKYGVLIDKDNDGILLQIFSKPVQARPSFFIEVIQRKGSTGFGGGNIRSLFEAIEREQVNRGTL